MKKLFTLLFISVFFIACSSGSDNSTSSNTTIAKAEFDNSNLGIYKGVFTGSSGIITLNIMNDGAINATMVLDGVTHTFTTTETVSAEGNISGLTFTSGEMSFDLAISQQGEVVEATALNFLGHPHPALNLLKEYSETLVTCYQGTFTGTSSGAFNLIVSENYVTGLAYDSVNDDLTYLDGTLNGTTLSGTYDTNEGTFTGTVSGNTLTGTWISTDQENPGSGNWTGQRTL